MRNIIFFFYLQAYLISPSFCQESTYDYIKAFKTSFYSDKSTDTRSVSGKPGFNYWQNQADYIIDVELDTLSDIIMGKEIIKYTNNSPDDLDFLWLHMEQNLLSKIRVEMQ